MKLMILGATGAVGSQVLNQAHNDARFETIVAPTRRPLANPGRAQNPVTSFDLPLPQADWWAVDAVIFVAAEVSTAYLNLGVRPFEASTGSISASVASPMNSPLSKPKMPGKEMLRNARMRYGECAIT